MPALPKFGYVGEKAKSIYIFPITEAHHKGERVVLKPNLTWDQIMEKLKASVSITIPATKVVDITGKPVHSYEELEDQGNYILCGAGKVDKSMFPKAALASTHTEEARVAGTDQIALSDHVAAKGTSAAPAYGTSQKSSHAPPTKFGTQREKSIAIFVFRNGDAFDKGTRMPIISYKTLEQLTTKVSSECRCIMPCRRLAHAVRQPDGEVKLTLVKALEDLEDGEKYIALGGEAPNKEKMSKYI